MFVPLHEVDLGVTIWVNPFQIQTLSPFEKNTRVSLTGGRTLLVGGNISDIVALFANHYEASLR